MGFIRSRSAIHPGAEVHRKLKQNFAGHNIWARGLMVSTVGRGETVIRDVVAPSSSRHGSFGGPNNSHGAQHQVGDEDGFAVGFIYGLLAGEPPEEAIKLGWGRMSAAARRLGAAAASPASSLAGGPRSPPRQSGPG